MIESLTLKIPMTKAGAEAIAKLWCVESDKPAVFVWSMDAAGKWQTVGYAV